MATVQPVTFAQALRHARLAIGLTQETLAERAGLAVRTISDLERGVRSAPYKATVTLLAQALQLSDVERAAFTAAALRYAPRVTYQPSQRATSHMVAAPPPLVGRRHELGRLQRHVASEQSSVLLLAGEPGIGKSRLLRETAEYAQTAGWCVVEGGCTRRSGLEPYAPVVGALARLLVRQSTARLRAHLHGCAWLVRLLPELAERVVVPLPEWALPPEQERRLVFAAVSRLLANIAAPNGTLLVLDDLQWAGMDALNLIESLVRAETERPLRLVGAYRSTEVSPSDPLGQFLADLARDGLADELAIGPLASDESTALVESLLPQGVSSTGEQDRIITSRQQLLSRASGVPFFLVSGARALESGVGTTIPWDVAQSIRQRLAALPQDAQEVLGAASVAGREVPTALLLALFEPHERSTLTALKSACRARLLVEMGRTEFSFAHDLVREVVEADLSVSQRAAWHRRIADWMERLPGRERRVAELARHYLESDRRGRALPYVLAAGDQAEAAYAHIEAEEHYRTALVLAREHGDQPHEAEAMEALHVALTNQANFDAAQEAAGEAATLYQALGDEEGALRALARYAEMCVAKGSPMPGLARLEPLRARIEVSTPSPAVVHYYATLSHLLFQSGRLTDALATAERAVALARNIGHATGLAHGQHVLINALRGLGRREDLERALEQIVPLAEAAGDHLHLAIGLGNVAFHRATSGDFVGASEPMERAVQVAEQLGEANCLADMLDRRGGLAFWRGEWDHASADFARALSLYRQIGPTVSAVLAPLFAAQLLIAQGQHDTARDYMEESLASVNEHMRTGPTQFARSLQAEHALLEGRPEAACDLLEPLYDSTWQGSDAPMLAWAYADLDQPDRANAALEPYLARANAERDVVASIAGWQAQAILFLRLHRWQEATEQLEQVIASCRRLPYPYAEAKALYVYGQLHVAQGEQDSARMRFAAALTILSRLGERLYAQQIKRALELIS